VLSEITDVSDISELAGRWNGVHLNQWMDQSYHHFFKIRQGGHRRRDLAQGIPKDWRPRDLARAVSLSYIVLRRTGWNSCMPSLAKYSKAIDVKFCRLWIHHQISTAERPDGLSNLVVFDFFATFEANSNLTSTWFSQLSPEFVGHLMGVITVQETFRVMGT
jgi:hypothetical protein